MTRKLKEVLLLVLLVVTTTTSTIAEDCVLPIDGKANYRNRWPLVFDRSSGELLETSRSTAGALIVRVSAGAEVLLSCAPNYLRQHQHQEQLAASCVGATGNFSVGHGHESLTCDLRVIEEVLDTAAVPGCVAAEQRTGVRYGYVHPIEQLTYVVGEACYDEQAGRTVYAHVKLNAKGSSYLQTQEKSYLTRKRHPDSRYKIELLRSMHFGELYERLRKAAGSEAALPMLSIRRLIGDSLLSNAQFQEVKKLGWNYFVGHEDMPLLEALEADIKRLSAQQPLDVYVGTQGVYTFGGLQVYLHDDKRRFPVPAHIWFLIKQGTGAVSGFLVANRGTQTTTDSPALCTGDCTKLAAWLEMARELPGLSCCTLAQLSAVVPELQQLHL